MTGTRTEARSGAQAGARTGPDRGAAPPRPDSIGALIGGLLRVQLAALVDADRAVRLEQPDAVHEMRIAVRRLRSTLSGYRRYLDAAAADALDAELRRLGGELGAARDSEVLDALLGEQAAELPEAAGAGPLRRRIAEWSAEQQRQGRAQALAALADERHTALLAELESLADAPVLRGRARRGARGELRRILVLERRRVGIRIAAAQRLPEGPERDRALHRARRAAKRARYTAEGAQSVAGRSARRLAVRLKALQTLLGEHQDAVLAQETLLRLAEQAHAAGEPGFGYGVLYAGQEAALRRTGAELPRCWAAVRRAG